MPAAGDTMIVLLVGNYLFDGSTSMQIWARTLERELRERGIDVRLISPRPFFGRWKESANGVGKWLGYIDRFLLFPPALRAAAAQADLVHMCDNGSAMYCTMLHAKPTVVTCNDMLAVRGAMGELPELRASLPGKLMQRWICRGLSRATRVACISQATFDDASRILPRSDHLSVILDALNHPFQPLPPGEAARRLTAVVQLEKPFLLHVGGGHARKNREGILRVFARVIAKADLQMVFAGEALSGGQLRLAAELGVSDRVVQIVKPDVTVIEALYNSAAALIFPSLYEGFGWPPIEAQACGCPVVASDIPSLSASLRDTAALHRPDDETGMAESILKLVTQPAWRDSLRELGFKNIQTRFHTSRMMQEYITLYTQLVSSSGDD